MIEAVNSTVANASLLRGNLEQVDASRQSPAIKSTESTAQDGLPQAPFVSPVVAFDPNAKQAVLQIRDAKSGDVLTQFPTERTLKLRAEQSARLAEERSISQTTTSSNLPSETAQPGQTSAGTSLSDVTQVQSTVVATNSGSSAPSTGTGVAEAQIAASALANGSAAGQTTSTNVNVTA